MQNIIIKGSDNPVIFTFTFTGEFKASGLGTFDYITVALGNESYSTQDANSKLIVSPDGNELTLNISDTTTLEVGSYTPVITGYSVTYNDGYVLNSEHKRLLTDTIVKG